MDFQGDLTLNVPHSEVWSFFQDIERLAACIPGCQSTELMDDGGYRAVMMEKLGPFRVNFDMQVTIEEIHEGKSIKAMVTGEDRKLFSTLKQTMEVTIREIGTEETHVGLTTEVTILGKIGSLGYGIIKRKADQSMKQFGEAVRAQLEGE